MKRLSHFVGAGCAGGGHRQAGAFCLKPDGNVARRHIGNHHGNKERRHPFGSLFQQFLHLIGHGDQPADTGAKVHPEPFWRHFAKNPAVLHRLAGGSHGILTEQIAFASLSLFHITKRIKILHLSCYFRFVFPSIKPIQMANSVFTGQKVFPKSRDIVPYRCYCSQAGYHYTSHVCILLSTWPVRRRPGSPHR